jgi:hypothetical protein
VFGGLAYLYHCTAPNPVREFASAPNTRGQNSRRVHWIFLSTRSMPSMVARLWTDVSFAVGNSSTSLTRTASKARSPRSAVSPRRVSSSAHNIVPRRRHSPPRRSLATHAARALEDEAFQELLSQSHGLPPSTGRGVSVYDESYDQSLKAASPLRSPPLGPPSPRFDWRLRATSRAAAKGVGLQPSHGETDSRTYIKRVIPQHAEIQSGERFHHEVNAYEER